MSQLSQPGAVQLSAPGNEAESGEWTLPGISLIHSFSLPKSLHRLLQCARQVSSAPCRARPAGGSRHSPGQGGLEAEPCPEEPATTDRRAPSSPWPMGRTRLGSLFTTIVHMVFALARSMWPTSVRTDGGAAQEGCGGKL